jgi:hypothetical protein
MEKSEIMYSKKVPESVKEDITQIMPMQRVQSFSKYLGMPTQLGRYK